MTERRQRLHQLVLALIGQQSDLDLLDGDDGIAGAGLVNDPATWLQRNRRLIQRYQALVRTAVTLDALIDQEVGQDAGNSDKLAPIDRPAQPT
jgi:hypothetical protein